MARRPFGGGGDAVVIDAETGDPLPFAVGTAWTARSGGDQIVDVADESGTTLPSSQIVTDAVGAIAPFLGPVDGTAKLWVDFGGGVRFLLACTDLPERVAAIEVVGVGVPATRTITTTPPLTGGGDLSANRTLAVDVGTSSSTVAAGDDSRIVGALQKSTATTKGDLFVATDSATVVRLGVGSNDQILTADSAQTSGVKWAAAPSGSGILATLLDAKGDIIAASAADTAARLAVGSNGQMLVADSAQSTGLRWAYVSPVVVSLTDASTVAVNAALGTHFRVTLGGNRTLGNPTNAVDGQRLLIEILQDGTGSRTITLDTKYALGTDIAAVTLTTTASKRDFLGAVYNSTADRFYVVAFTKGF